MFVCSLPSICQCWPPTFKHRSSTMSLPLFIFQHTFSCPYRLDLNQCKSDILHRPFSSFLTWNVPLMDFILQPQLNMMCIWYVMLILKSPKAHRCSRRRCRGNASIFLHLFSVFISKLFFFCSFRCSHFYAFVCVLCLRSWYSVLVVFYAPFILYSLFCSFFHFFFILFHFVFSSFCLSRTETKRILLF